MASEAPGSVYRTPPECAILHPSGRGRVGGKLLTRLPMLDVQTGLFARVSYAELEAIAIRERARLPSMETLREAWRIGLRLDTRELQLVVTKSDSTWMRGRGFCETHDRRARAQLAAAGWDGAVVANCGKAWIAGASPGKARNGGWFDSRGVPVQGGTAQSEWHDRDYTDYAQLAQLEWDDNDDQAEEPVPDTDKIPVLSTRSTIHRNGKNRPGDTAALQRHLGVRVDDAFGPKTEAALIAFQARSGLVADGWAGERTWRLLGEPWAPEHPSGHRPSPAALAALRDATAAWPTRRRVSDGIMGDARHQAGVSDHNLGLAVDITHDAASGCDAGDVALLAMSDPRTQYVIWRSRIWNRDRAKEGWRPYAGKNPHTSHCHVSIRIALRDNEEPWPWAPDAG